MIAGHLYVSNYDGRVLHIEHGVIRTLASFGTPPCGKSSLHNRMACVEQHYVTAIAFKDEDICLIHAQRFVVEYGNKVFASRQV